VGRAESVNERGIRRCQRLPEVTYSVDPTRPTRGDIKAHAWLDSPKLRRKPAMSCRGVLRCGRRR